jgi:hypothetical protein
MTQSVPTGAACPPYVNYCQIMGTIDVLEILHEPIRGESQMNLFSRQMVSLGLFGFRPLL